MDDRSHRCRSRFFLAAGLAPIVAALVIYSQTRAFAWDEGFHILAAQLILHGKRPYIDFVFSQTPLNAYWNAAWMGLLGETWRVPHAIAALCCGGAACLTALYIFERFPPVRWRLPGALLAAVLTGLNTVVFRFGGIAQAYGLCLLTIVAAWWFVALSPRRAGYLFPALAGAFCGIAAGASLLTAPAGPILLLWLTIYGAGEGRAKRAAAFLLGELIAVSPVLWLFLQGPRQVYFGIIDYNLGYRQLDWPDATRQNLEVFVSWIDSGPALVLLGLAATGLLWVRFRCGWAGDRKAEFYLCAWLSAGLGAYVSWVRPTFERYYLFTVPFLGILAIAGLFALASALYQPARPWPVVSVAAFLVYLGLAKVLYEERDDAAWPDFEETARKVAEVTPPDRMLFADEIIYFLTRHPPPSGMEMWNSHKFGFAPATLSLLHLIPQPKLDREVSLQAFGTLETCEDGDFIDQHGYAKAYSKSAEAGGCTVFWNNKALNFR